MKQEYWQKYLDEFISILTKNKIHYWLDGGILLGAIREGNFIGKDTDIDLGIYEFELNRQNYEIQNFISICIYFFINICARICTCWS